MHDPSTLIIAIPRPVHLDIWHDEPGGKDSGTVCGYAPHGPVRLWWTLRHVRHLHYRFWPYLHVKRWIVDRCDGCGRRFFWKDGRYSYQGTSKVWHNECMALRHVRSDLADLTGYILGTADDTARWRAECRLSGIDQPKGSIHPA